MTLQSYPRPQRAAGPHLPQFPASEQLERLQRVVYVPDGFVQPSYFTYKAAGQHSATLVRPSRAAPAPPAPLPLGVQALPAQALPALAPPAWTPGEVAVTVGSSEEALDDRLLQEQLARIRGSWGQE